MFANAAKAIVALIMSVIFLINHFFGTGIELSQSDVSSVVTLIASIATPLLVYFVPNAPK